MQETEQGELELRLLNEDKHDEIEKLLGMQRPKKAAPTARPRLLPDTRSPSVTL